MKINKKVYIELKGDAKDFYIELQTTVENQFSKGKNNSKEIKLWKGIQRILDRIKENPLYGKNAKKELIPRYYTNEHNAENIRIADLPFFWRLIYTLDSTEEDLTIFVLDIFSHDNYNKRFGFRKR